MAKSERSYNPLGDGIEFTVDGNILTLRINLDAAKGKPSASGKMILTGNTGGWQMIPGGDGVKVNVMVGRRTGA